jgi:DHA2 family methylenomycin A resistance protein-like MFS transporter
MGLGNLAMYTLLLSVPLLLADRSGSSNLQTGLVLTSLSASTIIMALFGGRLADRFGRRLPTLIGLALMALGVLPIALIGTGIALSSLVGGLALIGIGLGLSIPGLQTTAVESVSGKDAGIAAGIYSTSRYLGSILGAAILVGLLGTNRSDTSGLAVVFVIVFAAAALATLVSLGLRARPAACSEEQGEWRVSATERGG